MLGLAGRPLGLEFLFVDPAPNPPAKSVGEHLALDYGSPAAIARLASCDVVTYEFENVPVAAVQALAERTVVYPPASALAVAQDRLHEKSCFAELGIPTPAFFDVASQDDLTRALAEIGYPAVLKTRRFGYDGRGQAVLRSQADAERAYAELGRVPLLLEGFVPFERELSLIGARSARGEIRFYPLVENHHTGGILRLTLAPAPNVTAERQAMAEGYLRAIASATSACSRSSSFKRAGAWSRTKWPRESTTRATSRSRVRARASSSNTCAPCSACRSVRPSSSSLPPC
jgi:5-(carboxyamino)imidazole ribonucleotide synthase